MGIVLIKPDLKNSPRNLFLKDIHAAFAHYNKQYLAESFSDNTDWKIIGRKELGSSEKRIINVKRLTICKVEELIIESIITDGLGTCFSGKVSFTDKSQFLFSNIFTFKSTVGKQIDNVTTFLLRH